MRPDDAAPVVATCTGGAAWYFSSDRGDCLWQRLPPRIAKFVGGDVLQLPAFFRDWQYSPPVLVHDTA